MPGPPTPASVPSPAPSTSADPDVAPARTASVAFILVTLVLDTLGVGVVIPVMPRLVGSFVHNDVAAASRYYGVFVATFAAMQFVFAPVLGGLSDRYGRRPVLLLSLFCAACNYVLLALAPSLGWLFVSRVFLGITAASISTATAYIADVTPAEKRAASFGLVGAAFGLGFIAGPALGGFLGRAHPRLPFLVSAALNFLNCAYGFAVLPESLSPARRRPFSLRASHAFGTLGLLRRYPVALGLTSTLVCTYLSQQVLQSVWALYGQGRFNWDELDVGASLALVGLASGLVQGVLVRAAIGRLGERRTLGAGLVVSVVGFVLFACATRSWMMYAVIPLFALGSVSGPALQGMMSREVAASEQGQLQGALTSLQSLTAIAGPLLGTRLLAEFSAAHAAARVPGAPFLAAAGFNAVGLVLAARLFARTPTGAPPKSVGITQ